MATATSAGRLAKGKEMEEVVLLEGGHCGSYGGTGSTHLREVRAAQTAPVETAGVCSLHMLLATGGRTV